MNKKVDFAFGKKIYFLGVNQYGENVWLEEASWDCNWYWGFGYVETYTNNENPSKSRDISSHSHFEGLCFVKNGDKYIYHIKEVLDTPLSEKEAWELSDLMKRFYAFREVAEICHRGNSNYTSGTSYSSKNEELEKYINEIELPNIFQAVYRILSPEE